MQASSATTANLPNSAKATRVPCLESSILGKSCGQTERAMNAGGFVMNLALSSLNFPRLGDVGAVPG